MRVGVLTLMLLLLSGCGFQLRGAGMEALSELSFTGTNRAPVTFREIREALQVRDVQIVSSAPGILAVHILDEQSQRRSVATTNVIDAAEYELSLSLSFSISKNGDALVDDAMLIAERVYAVDSANLSGSFEEQTLLMTEMRRELAQKLVRRIDLVSGNHSSAGAEPAAS